jgi:hypothetical protein
MFQLLAAGFAGNRLVTRGTKNAAALEKPFDAVMKKLPLKLIADGLWIRRSFNLVRY